METTEKKYVEALRDEHAELFEHIEKLEEVLDTVQTPMELSRQLHTVRTEITEHFYFEEDGGYMTPLLKEEPRFGGLVKHLLAEHRAMSETLDAIIKEVHGAISVGDGTRDRARAWVKQLRHHESKENRLVQEAYYSTGATGD